MNFKKYASNSIVDIIFVFTMGLLSLGWFKEDLLVAGGDWNLLSFPDYARYYYIWEYGISTGVINSRVFPLIPFSIFLLVSEKMGFSLVTTEKIIFYFIFTSCGLSMYYLTSSLVNGRIKRIACLLSAFFYMLNPYTRTFIWHDVTLFAFLYAFLPLILAMYIKVVEKKQVKYVILLFLALLLASPAYTNPMAIAIISILIILYFVYYILQKWKNISEIKLVSKFTVFTIIIFFSLSVWWVLPLMGSFSEEFSSTSVESIGLTNLETLNLNSKDTSFLNVFRLEGHWAVGETSKGDPYYTWAENYSSNIFLYITGFLIPLFVFSSLLTKSKKRYNLLYFAILSLVGLFLVKGSHPPFGGIYIWFFENFPLSGIFRVQYHKLGMIVALGYAFLIGVGISELCSFIKQYDKHKLVSKMFLILICFLLFVAHEYPFWTGEVIPKGGSHLYSFHVKVPEYYNNANYWLDEQNLDFRIYSLPLINLYGRALMWEYGYGGADPSLYLFPKPVISSNNIFNEDVSEKNLGKILAVMNVKYILLHNDADYKFYNISYSPEFIKTKLDLKEDIHLENSFNQLDFYKIPDEYFLPHIYPTVDATYIDGNISTLIPLFSAKDLDINQAFFFSDLNEKDDFLLEKANKFVLCSEKGRDIEPIKTIYKYSDYQDFEDGLDDWSVETFSDSVVRITEEDKHSGNLSAEVALSGHGSSTHIYKDFGYDGESPINIDLWVKVVEREKPSGAFVYITGYNITGSEKARIIYHTYENWDYETSTPEDNKQTFYVAKVHLGDKPFNTWINVNRDSRDDFHEKFPHIWDELNLTKIRVDLYCWGDGKITARYDDVKVSGIIDDPIVLYRSDFEVEVTKEGKYQVYNIADKGNEDQKTNNLRLLEGSNIAPIETKGSDYQSFEDGLGDWSVSVSSGDAALLTGKDWNSGDFSVEMGLDGPGSSTHIYKDFGYDGESQISIDLWMKVVERKEPAGAFVYIRGYDSNGTEKTRIIYSTYDNWDHGTSTPEENDQTFYVVKVNLGNPSYNTWINLNRNPKGDFDEIFPTIWDELNLTKIRVDLYCWGDGAITARYDDIKVYGMVGNLDILLVGSPEINDLKISAPSNDTYNIFALVKSNPKQLTIPINLTVEAPRLINRIEASNPSFHPHDCTYTPSFSNDTLNIRTFFDGPPEEEEYVEVKELIHRLSVNEYPGVSISCKVENQDVQKIKMGFKVKNESGAATTIWKGLEPSEEWHTYEINLYDTILRTYPDENYTMSEITIVPYKRWSLDCSWNKKGAYTYYIKDLSVSKSKTTTEYPIVEFNIGGETFKTELNISSFEWIKIGEIYLEEGEHTVTWTVAGEGDIEIDSIRAVPKGQMFDPKDVDDSEPSVIFQKINPTKYKVHVSAEEPFFLVFSESYHPQWKAYLDKRPFEFNDIIASYDNVDVKEAEHEMKFTPGDISYLFANPISDDKHFIVNGYANSWYIEKTGDYDLTLYFLPQSLFYLGVFISGGTLFGCFGYLVWSWRKGDKRTLKFRTGIRNFIRRRI